jgi:hypothetical protein
MPEIAIVGVAAVFPGAADAAAFWANIARGHDAITEVPATRWEPVFFDPKTLAADRFYCRRGGFVDDVAAVDPVQFGIMPVAAEGAEPDQLLALHVAAAALDDAGLRERLPRDRTAVILGRGGYLTPGMARLAARVRTPQQVATTLGELWPELDAATRDRVRVALMNQAGTLGPESRDRSGAQPGRVAHRQPARPARPGVHHRRRLRELAHRRRPGRQRAPLGPLPTWCSPAASTTATTSRSGASSPSSGALSPTSRSALQPRRRRHPDRRGHRHGRAQAPGRRRARRRPHLRGDPRHRRRQRRPRASLMSPRPSRPGARARGRRGAASRPATPRRSG